MEHMDVYINIYIYGCYIRTQLLGSQIHNYPLDVEIPCPSYLGSGRQAGVYLDADSCLVVLTRTIGLSALDGLLLGWEPWLNESMWMC